MTIELNPQQERFRSMDEPLHSLATPTDTTVLSARLTPAVAAARIHELRKGNVLPEGMTIRAMIDEGRA